VQASDRQLVARVVATRDERAFEELIMRHQSRVRNWLRQLARDTARADDLAQETFIRAWDRVEGLKEPDRFSQWLMKIAYTEFLQSQRKHASTQRMLESFERESSGAQADEPGSAAADVAKLLAVLNDEERAAMVLCYAHGYSHHEIAELTDRPVGTIKSQIARGKDKIRARFGIDVPLGTPSEPQ
jgi:RNA polymerase sigma-70 factor (ECF subfamily)